MFRSLSFALALVACGAPAGVDVIGLGVGVGGGGGAGLAPEFQRFAENPLITQAMVEAGGPGTDENGNGSSIAFPAVVAIPDGTSGKLADYYMYFSHHHGSFIRYATADNLRGPWTYRGAALTLVEVDTAVGGDPTVAGHIASADVFWFGGSLHMYFHAQQQTWGHKTGYASSTDGLTWTVQGTGGIAGNGYWAHQVYSRHFYFNAQHFAVGRSGSVIRMGANVNGPQLQAADDPPLLDLIDPDYPLTPPRHFGCEVVGSRLDLAHTMIGDAPERIYQTSIALTPPNGAFNEWIISAPRELARPALVYEGSTETLGASADGGVYTRVHQLRDPYYFRDTDGARYMFYASGGEDSISAARLR